MVCDGHGDLQHSYPLRRDRLDVEVVGANGVRHTMLGFATETAEAWIISDRLMEKASGRDGL